MLPFVFGRLQEYAGNLLETLFFGYSGKVGVLVARLRFAGKRG